MTLSSLKDNLFLFTWLRLQNVHLMQFFLLKKKSSKKGKKVSKDNRSQGLQLCSLLLHHRRFSCKLMNWWTTGNTGWGCRGWDGEGEIWSDRNDHCPYSEPFSVNSLASGSHPITFHNKALWWLPRELHLSDSKQRPAPYCRKWLSNTFCCFQLTEYSKTHVVFLLIIGTDCA